MSFLGLEFPVESMRIRGGLRDHVHEYPHSPGGAPEKLGRRLYEIDITANFQTTFRKWPNLWPQRLYDLQRKFEAQETGDLVIPWMGTIQAYCVQWDREMTARILSGERAYFRFREDQNAAFLVDNLIEVSTQSLKAAGDRFNNEWVAEDRGVRPTLFDQILDSVNSALALIDTGNAYISVVEAKLLGVVSLCREADQRLELFQRPEDNAMLEAMKQIWAAAVELHAGLLKKESPPVSWPRRRARKRPRRRRAGVAPAA